MILIPIVILQVVLLVFNCVRKSHNQKSKVLGISSLICSPLFLFLSIYLGTMNASYQSYSGNTPSSQTFLLIPIILLVLIVICSIVNFILGIKLLPNIKDDIIQLNIKSSNLNIDIEKDAEKTFDFSDIREAILKRKQTIKKDSSF